MLGHFYFRKDRNHVLLTNDTGLFCFLTVQEFEALVQSGYLPKTSEKWMELVDKHFCFDGSEESYIRNTGSAIREGNRYLFDATNLFIFAITNECNNRCIYCQANGCRQPEKMSEDVAEAALHKIARSPAKSITIEFQGREPLMNEHIIRYIVNRSKDLLSEKRVCFTIVSNLSLLNEDMAQFIKENQVSVSTSLDGPQNLHDINRPAANGNSSFEMMLKGKRLLNNIGIFPGAIETTTAMSLNRPEEIVDTYVQNGFSQLFIRPLTRLGAAGRAWNQIGYTPEAFVTFYRKALDRILWYNMQGVKIYEYQASLFLSKALHGYSVNYMELRSPCGAGLGQMAITANGNVYTCDEGRMMAEMGDEAFCLGNVFSNEYDDWIESPACKAVCSASLLETSPGCCDCVYKPYCGVCPVVNYAIHGNISQNSVDRCKINRGIWQILFEYIKDGNPKQMEIFNDWSDRI